MIFLMPVHSVVGGTKANVLYQLSYNVTFSFYERETTVPQNS